ncbi:PilZ domain-containing protein [Pelagibius sp. Alg239-R121]|uniref:PilZ domain-containing protein n=1 Tax=Pelagibius sp. Alg239-R121 TaxID=2993448 RepID=UPI0024A76A3F|nr:PilZ domain-containing protein [Pelagibius sp. Alg239-R121]
MLAQTLICRHLSMPVSIEPELISRRRMAIASGYGSVTGNCFYGEEVLSLTNSTVHSLKTPDQRHYKRAQVVLSGCLINEIATLDCAVIDLSINGARVCLDDAPDDKQIIKLRLARSTDLNVEVVWQEDGILGLQFTDDPCDVANILDGLLPEDCLDSSSGLRLLKKT